MPSQSLGRPSPRASNDGLMTVTSRPNAAADAPYGNTLNTWRVSTADTPRVEVA